MQGTYSDLKIIKSRKVVQVIVELPIEQANAFVEMFGMPNPAEEVWVAIAELNRRTMNETEVSAATKAVQMAGMLCKTPNFGVWLRDFRNLDVDQNNPESIATALRALLGIKSRTEMHNSPEIVTAFNRLKGEYDSNFMEMET